METVWGEFLLTREYLLYFPVPVLGVGGSEHAPKV